MTVRDGLLAGVADRGVAFANADLSSALQRCVRDLVAQRVVE